MTIDFLDSADLESPVRFDIHTIRHDIMSTIVARVFDVANPTSKHPATSGTILYLYRLPQYHRPVYYLLNAHKSLTRHHYHYVEEQPKEYLQMGFSFLLFFHLH